MLRPSRHASTCLIPLFPQATFFSVIIYQLLKFVWLYFFHHSIFITHHSSLITQFFTSIWHHHPIFITQYFSHYLWAHTCQPVQFFFLVPKLTEANIKNKKKLKQKVKRWSKVVAVGPLYVFNYNITIELWVIETENS